MSAMFSVLRQGTCNNRFAQQCGRRASQVNGTCCCWYKVAVILCFFTMSSSLQLCHKLRLDAVHKLEKYTCMIYVDCQASWYCEFQKLSLTPDPIFLLTIVKKPQCTKSLGPNQPQNLKLRLCIWQQGSLLAPLSERCSSGAAVQWSHPIQSVRPLIALCVLSHLIDSQPLLNESTLSNLNQP